MAHSHPDSRFSFVPQRAAIFWDRIAAAMCRLRRGVFLEAAELAAVDFYLETIRRVTDLLSREAELFGYREHLRAGDLAVLYPGADRGFELFVLQRLLAGYFSELLHVVMTHDVLSPNVDSLL
jgi:hypothetical protein